MKNSISSWCVGFIFAIGLGLSGMTQPQKIIAFLDIFGSWSPALLFVMAGAIVVHFFTYRWIRKRNSPLFSGVWHVPENPALTPSLVVGSLLFGVGWGLGGYCPGPAIVSLASLQLRPLYFVASMLLGMFLFKKIDQKFKFRR